MGTNSKDTRKTQSHAEKYGEKNVGSDEKGQDPERRDTKTDGCGGCGADCEKSEVELGWSSVEKKRQQMDHAHYGVDTKGRQKKSRAAEAKVERRVTQDLLENCEGQKSVVQNEEGGHFPEWMIKASVSKTVKKLCYILK